MLAACAVLVSCTFPDFAVDRNAARRGEDETGGSAGRAGATNGGMPASGSSGAGTNMGGSAGNDTSGSAGNVASAGVGGALGEGGEAGARPVAFEEPSGSVLELNGNHIVMFAKAPLDDLTIEMWIKTTMVGDTGAFYRGAALFDADTPGNANDFGATLVESNFAFGTGNPDTSALSQTAVNTGEWVHVAGVRNRSTGMVRVLVNGLVESTLISNSRLPLDGADFPGLGGHFDKGSFYNGYVGSVDEIRLWNVARTPREIAENMHVRLVGNEPGLVGYWHLDDGQGTIATDCSPSHADATLGGGDPARVPSWAPFTP